MSVADQISSAVAARLAALEPAVPVFRRRTPSLPPGTAPPATVVTVGPEADTEDLWENRVAVLYPVLVARFTAGGQLLAEDTAARDWREAARKALADRTTYASVPGFNKARATRPPAVYDPAGADAKVTVTWAAAEVETLENAT
jgi:hypothetical protein